MQAARIVRREILQKRFKFDGSLDDNQCDDLPQLITLPLQIILCITNIQTQIENSHDIRDAVVSIAQLVIINNVKRSGKSTDNSRHNLDGESLLPLYLGLMIHCRTRKCDLMDCLCRMTGFCN